MNIDEAPHFDGHINGENDDQWFLVFFSPTFRHHNWSNWRSSLGLDSRQSLSQTKTTRQTQSISRLFHMQISEATLSSLDHPQEDAQFVGRPSMMPRFLQLPRWCFYSNRKAGRALYVDASSNSMAVHEKCCCSIGCRCVFISLTECVEDVEDTEIA